MPITTITMEVSTDTPFITIHDFAKKCGGKIIIINGRLGQAEPLGELNTHHNKSLFHGALTSVKIDNNIYPIRG